MSDDDATRHYNTTEQAYNAGLRKGKELQKQETEEEGQRQEDDAAQEGLTFEQIQNMDRQELIDRKPEVDKALEAMGNAGDQR